MASKSRVVPCRNHAPVQQGSFSCTPCSRSHSSRPIFVRMAPFSGMLAAADLPRGWLTPSPPSPLPDACQHLQEPSHCLLKLWNCQGVAIQQTDNSVPSQGEKAGLSSALDMQFSGIWAVCMWQLWNAFHDANLSERRVWEGFSLCPGLLTGPASCTSVPVSHHTRVVHHMGPTASRCPALRGSSDLPGPGDEAHEGHGSLPTSLGLLSLTNTCSPTPSHPRQHGTVHPGAKQKPWAHPPPLPPVCSPHLQAPPSGARVLPPHSHPGLTPSCPHPVVHSHLPASASMTYSRPNSRQREPAQSQGPFSAQSPAWLPVHCQQKPKSLLRPSSPTGPGPVPSLGPLHLVPKSLAACLFLAPSRHVLCSKPSS